MDAQLSPDQAIRLIALASMLKEGDVAFRGYEEEDELEAAALVRDIGEEIALQVNNLIEDME
jgi:hypothetical protein